MKIDDERLEDSFPLLWMSPSNIYCCISGCLIIRTRQFILRIYTGNSSCSFDHVCDPTTFVSFYNIPTFQRHSARHLSVFKIPTTKVPRNWIVAIALVSRRRADCLLNYYLGYYMLPFFCFFSLISMPNSSPVAIIVSTIRFISYTRPVVSAVSSI